MSFTLTGKLVVAISSRALFDFEEENRIFESSDDSAYMKLQLERLVKQHKQALPSRSSKNFLPLMKRVSNV